MAAFGCEVEGAGVEVSSDRGSVTNRAGEQSSFREGQRPMNQVSLEDNREANPHLTQGARGRRERGVFTVSFSRLLTCSGPDARAGRRPDSSTRRRQSRDQNTDLHAAPLGSL